MPLYAKIGCMERETFTSTKLELHVYTDRQCSQPYRDFRSSREHSKKGYVVGNYEVSTKVSFRPPFYSCTACTPEGISATFNKKSGSWYDDDYISQYGNKYGNYRNDRDQHGDDKYQDDYFDDKYLAANDDTNHNDDGNYNKYKNRGGSNGDDYYGGRLLTAVEAGSETDLKVRTPLVYSSIDIRAKLNGVFTQAYHDDFWTEFREMMRRSLYDNYYDIGNWNMCQRIYKYGVWCDKECRSLDFFRRDEWSTSDVVLLAIMSTFMTAMMLLVVAKRLKAQQRARIYGDEQPMPGLPPFAMVIIFFVIMTVIITLAKLKFINETLVFAVVTCILLFIYMLKLTLFENRKPVLLAAPRHDMFDNPLDDRFID